jgi:hypothetical protein
MSALSIQPTYPIFTDIDGQPLEDGYVWVGTANLDPQTNPIAVFWDAALTIAAVQPIRTLAGYPSNSGTPARLYVNSDYSIRVMNKKGSTVYSAPASTERYSGSLISQISADQVSTTAKGVGAATNLTQQDYNDNAVYATQFGVVGNGIADDTAALQAALNAHKHVIVPAGLTPLITSTISIPDRTKLEFFGGKGIFSGVLPGSYLIKASTVTGNGVELNDGGVLIGGGLICQSGNAGDGLAIIGNRFVVRDFYVFGAGNDGIRVGTSGGANCNVGEITSCVTRENGRDGLNIHDGAGTAPNVNVITVSNHNADGNTRHGIYLGNCFWNSIITPTTQTNGGWGIYFDSTVFFDVLPSCRYNSIFGGDFNEGNVTGQAYIGGYGNVVYMPGRNQGLDFSGGQLCSLFGSNSVTGNGAVVKVEQIVAQDGAATTPSVLKLRNEANTSNGRGVAMEFLTPNGSGTSRTGGKIRSEQQTTNKDWVIFSANNGGVLTDYFGIYPNNNAVSPSADGLFTFGHSGSRWGAVFLAPRTLASLGAAASSTGARAMVSDATVVAAGNFGAVVTGGGANTVPVYSDGTNWRIG